MDTMTFTELSKLSALVPLVGITSGRCFAGTDRCPFIALSFW